MSDAEKWTVWVPEPIAESGLDMLRKIATVIGPSSAEADEHGVRTPLAENAVDAVIVRTREIDAATIARSERLQVIAKHGVGLDNIDVDTATRHGVIVTRTPGQNVTAVSEHTIGMLFALRKRFLPATYDIREGVWNRSSYIAPELSGDTLGVIGLGAIGEAVANRAMCFGMDVVGVDPYVDPSSVPEGVTLLDSVAAVAEAADALTVHVPLTEETEGVIGADELALLPPSGVVINCARGGIVDETALHEALIDGTIAGAGLDVFLREPVEPNHPLLSHDNVLVTPHCAGSSVEALDGMAIAAVEDVHAVLSGRVPPSAVNAAAIDERSGR